DGDVAGHRLELDAALADGADPLVPGGGPHLGVPGLVDVDVTGSGACVQRALDPPEPDVAGRGADVGGPADVAEPDVAARGVELDLGGRAGPRLDVDASRRHTED